MPSTLGKPSSSWRVQSFWSKAWTYALLALMVVFSQPKLALGRTAAHPNGKRIFSPGFIVLCVFVGVAELVALNLPYGVIDEMSQ